MRHDPSIPALGSLEAKIMQVRWERPGEYLSVRATRRLLDGDPACTTVMTVMGRLSPTCGRRRPTRCAGSWDAVTALR